MKKFIIGLFRSSPTCTGLLLLLISCHLTGIKDFTESWTKAPEVFWDIVIIYLLVVGAFNSWYLQDVEADKRERSTWIVVLTSVIVLILLAKFVSI